MRTLATLGVGLISLIVFGLGTYNTFVVNSYDFLNDGNIKFTRTPGVLHGDIIRNVASISWNKFFQENRPTNKKLLVKKPGQKIVENGKSQERIAVSEDVELKLFEFYNSKKYKKILTNEDFVGNMTATQTTIESLEVKLPGNETLSFSHAEIMGNVFTYDMNGEKYSGMIYPMDRDSYMVTLTDGPFEGSRMKFVGAAAGHDNGENDGELSEQLEAQDNLATTEKGTPVVSRPEDQNMQKEALTEEQMDDQVAKAGFNFSEGSNDGAVQQKKLTKKSSNQGAIYDQVDPEAY